MSPKKVTLVPLPGKPKTSEQMLAAVEMLAEKLRQHIAENAAAELTANPELQTPVAAAGG